MEEILIYETSAQLISRLIDDGGKDITGYDIEGELCLRGPTVINGYFGNPKANADSYDEDGFFKTGDVVYCDGKTKLWYIVDRKKVGDYGSPFCLPGLITTTSRN